MVYLPLRFSQEPGEISIYPLLKPIRTHKYERTLKLQKHLRNLAGVS